VPVTKIVGGAILDPTAMTLESIWDNPYIFFEPADGSSAGIMIERSHKRQLLLISTVLLAFVITACSRESQTLRPAEASQQVTEAASIASSQTSETIETTTETKEAISQRGITSTDAPIDIFDAILLFDPITEIEMVFVEGGTMVIQGQEISLDSFYISMYVLNVYFVAKAFDWAIERGYEKERQFPWPLPPNWPGAENGLVNWEDALKIANWLSIKKGLTPVYWRGDMLGPILTHGDLRGFGDIPTVGESGAFIRFFPFFYINWDADGYRMPTEAEWEFAARGGNKSRGYRYAGSDTLAEVLTNFRSFPPDIQYIPGQRKPNELGIHDMSGQSPEWVFGPWTEYGELEPPHNPNRIPRLDFLESPYLIQKGGNTLHLVLTTTRSITPEDRLRFRLWRDESAPRRDFEEVSLRLVRSAVLQHTQPGESVSHE